MTITVKFVVNAATEGNEDVFVVGDDERIGSWNPQRAVRMEKDNTELKRWHCLVDLSFDTDYCYRFFIGKSRKPKIKNMNGADDLVVGQWEAHLRPRQFSTGSTTTLELPEANFGIHDSTKNVSNGWLMDQCEIQLRLHSNPISIWKSQHMSQAYNVKCMAVDCSLNQDPQIAEEDDLKFSDSTEVFVSNLSHEDCATKAQNSEGTIYHHNDYIIFKARISDSNVVGFQFDLYQNSPSRIPHFIGSAHLLPLLQNKSKFVQTLPIMGKGIRPVGALNVEILVIKSVPDVNFAMDSSFITYWDRSRQNRRVLDIGHRGLGESYSLLNNKRENTLSSFHAAADHGADGVEFDVVMTKDFIPVIYHDFTVKIACAQEKSSVSGHGLHEIPIKELTLEQLQSLKLFSAGSKHVTFTRVDVIKHLDIKDEKDSDSSEAFPTLETILSHTSKRLSFDIEIKYPQMLADGVCESENFFDPNFYVDKILKVILGHAGDRKIVFSSFDPDICCLLQLKQKRYPVMFLSQGETHIYTHYMDYRCKTFQTAIRFAVAEQILGLVLHAEVLLRDMGIIESVKEKKLALYIWGGDNNNKDLIRKLREHKVDGIIYDRMDCHRPEHQYSFVTSDDSIPFLEEPMKVTEIPTGTALYG